MDCWMIRAGKDGKYAADWVKGGVCGIRLNLQGADISVMGREEIADAYRRACSTQDTIQTTRNIDAFYRLAHVLRVGIVIDTFDTREATFYVGQIADSCTNINGRSGLMYARPVRWTERVRKKSLILSPVDEINPESLIYKMPVTLLGDLLLHAIEM